VKELRSDCTAKAAGGRPLIEETLASTKKALGVAPDRDWLRGYYQYCNRLSMLNLLRERGVPTWLVFIYFHGDAGDPGRTCPASEREWDAALQAQREHVGLSADHSLSDRVHTLFLPVQALK
jgi:hypothetical protein